MKFKSKAQLLSIIWRHILTPLGVLTLYCLSLYLFYDQILPNAQSVNTLFVTRTWKYSLVLTAVSYLIFFVVFKTTKGAKLSFGNNVERISVFDLILLLLPMTPVIQYVLNNQEILSPLGILYILGVFIIFSALYAVIVPTLLGPLSSAKTLMLLGVTFSFMITNMASLSQRYNWFEAGSLKIQLLIFFIILVAGRLLYTHQATRKSLYIFVAVFFITGIIFQFVPGDGNGFTPANIDAKNKLVELASTKQPANKPNIYLLVYDSYVSNVIMGNYGIDNSSQGEFLRKLDFELYPHTYSVGGASIATMSRVLNASNEYYGSWRRGVSGDGIVQKLLKSFGYKTHGIFPYDYFFRGVGSSYDISFPEPKTSSSYKLLVKSIFMGEFRSGFDTEFGSPSRKQFVERKKHIFKTPSSNPRFVYMHSHLPGHSQNSGTCRPNEIDLYKKDLAKANQQMKRDVKTIIQNNPDAIIIVASDHGPYLTKNCTVTGSQYDISEISRRDIQDRFGTFLAIKWPTKNFSKYDDITVLQDLFPAIFAYLFEDDKFLEAKVEPITLLSRRISGAKVKNGIIYGGKDDGEPLFVNEE